VAVRFSCLKWHLLLRAWTEVVDESPLLGGARKGSAKGDTVLISPAEFSVQSAEAPYANDWGRFLAWCEERQVAPIAADPEVVAEFLEAEAALGYSSMIISHRLAAIGHMHRRHRALPPLLHKNGGVIRRTMARVGPVRSVQRPLQATTKVLQNILQSIVEEPGIVRCLL
jgi:hypothetical protein